MLIDRLALAVPETNSWLTPPCCRLPLVVLMLSEYVPGGVAAVVVSVNVDEQVGLHDAGENEAVAPVGRPEAENETDCAVPEIRLAVIVSDTDCPWTTA